MVGCILQRHKKHHRRSKRLSCKRCNKRRNLESLVKKIESPGKEKRALPHRSPGVTREITGLSKTTCTYERNNTIHIWKTICSDTGVQNGLSNGVEQKEVLLVYSAGRLNPKPKKLSSDRSSAVSFSSRKEQRKFGSTMWTWGIGAREHTNFIFQKTRQIENGIWRSEIQLAIIKKHKHR